MSNPINPTNTSVSNPAGVAKPERDRKRIPMSIPTRKLEIPDLPGFRLYWFKEENIARAIRAGYEFVRDDEVDLNDVSIAGDAGGSGNQALDSKVSVAAGTGPNGVPASLTLMKIREEWFNDDQGKIAERNHQIMGAIFQGEKIVGPEGKISERQNLTYVDKDRTKTSLFNRPARKKSLVRKS